MDRTENYWHAELCQKMSLYICWQTKQEIPYSVLLSCISNRHMHPHICSGDVYVTFIPISYIHTSLDCSATCKKFHLYITASCFSAFTDHLVSHKWVMLSQIPQTTLLSLYYCWSSFDREYVVPKVGDADDNDILASCLLFELLLMRTWMAWHEGTIFSKTIFDEDFSVNRIFSFPRNMTWSWSCCETDSESFILGLQEIQIGLLYKW